MRRSDWHAEGIAPGSLDASPAPMHLAAATLARQFAGPGSVNVISPRGASIVDALERAGFPRRSLVSREMDPAFVRKLSSAYPAAHLIPATPDAAPILLHSATVAGRAPGAVLCSLPLMLMPKIRCAEFDLDCLHAAPSSVFITWAPRFPLPARVPGLRLAAVSRWRLLSVVPCRAWVSGRRSDDQAEAQA